MAPAQAKIHSLQEKLSAVEIARTECAAGKTLQEWTQIKTQTDARTAALNQILQKLAAKAEKSRQIDNKKELLSKLQADWVVANERYETQVKLADSLADTVEALEQTAAMRSLVERLSDERAKLVDGSPCPLCGAVHHPYAESRPSILSDDSQKLDRTKKDWKDAQKSVTVFAKELAKLDGSIKAEQQALEELKKSSCKNCKRLSLWLANGQFPSQPLRISVQSMKKRGRKQGRSPKNQETRFA